MNRSFRREAATIVTPETRQRITEVCEQAAQVRPEEREGFVAKQCQGNDDLLREVKSALPEYLRTRKSGDVVVAVNEALPPPPPMLRIGRYEITGTIGSGGSGQVYSALDRTVGRVVAIKVLSAPGNPDLVRRFQAEAKTVANLHHKNIVTVHEYGEENGVPYLVMEYLDGTTLQELIRRQSLSLLEKVEIMTEVAEGLQYAHECGITHRDVKPANIMQLTDRSVKIMDFGIARWGESATRLTQTGLLIGSIMYMAPEQFSGTADALTDVFAYGVTFYELVTGVNPYAAADPVSIIFKIANSEPEPPRQSAPECPAGLESLILRALAREREARYSSLSDVLADTRDILSELRCAEADRLHKEADELFAAGQLDFAKTSVRKALRLDPGHEECRQLRSEIEEAVRRRDAAVRFETLLGQAEAAVSEQRFEDAAGLLDSMRELGVTNPNLQPRMDWVAGQVEQARVRDKGLYEAENLLREQNLTQAYHAVAEVLSSDPSNQLGKELLQDIRRQIAAREAQQPKTPAVPPAESRGEQIAKACAEAERLIASQEFERAMKVLEEAIDRLGDDWDLARLQLQAKISLASLHRPEPVEAPADPVAPAEPAPADDPDIERWRAEIGKLDATLSGRAAPPPPRPVDPPSLPPPQVPPPREDPDATRELPSPAITPEPRPPRIVKPARNSKAIWIALASVVLIGIALVAVLLRGKLHPQQPVAGLTIDEVTAQTVMRDAPYSLDLRASVNTPLAWSVRDGSLPGGLTLNSETGRISGMAGTAGAFHFVVHAQDPAGQSAEQPVTINVTEPQGSAGGGTAPPVPACKAAAFNMEEYGDLPNGELTWTGSLPAGSQLEIRNHVASFGGVRGDIFPKGVPIRITVLPSSVRVVTSPAAGNCWDPRLVLENPVTARSEVRIRWEVAP
ncbi:MAG TPA: protein kinase [Bryobacteraceae bacterium]|nr:protein kinase [Bryobacteraceae bacterium]